MIKGNNIIMGNKIGFVHSISKGKYIYGYFLHFTLAYQYISDRDVCISGLRSLKNGPAGRLGVVNRRFLSMWWCFRVPIRQQCSELSRKCQKRRSHNSPCGFFYSSVSLEWRILRLGACEKSTAVGCDTCCDML